MLRVLLRTQLSTLSFRQSRRRCSIAGFLKPTPLKEKETPIRVRLHCHSCTATSQSAWLSVISVSECMKCEKCFKSVDLQGYQSLRKGTDTGVWTILIRLEAEHSSEDDIFLHKVLIREFSLRGEYVYSYGFFVS